MTAAEAAVALLLMAAPAGGEGGGRIRLPAPTDTADVPLADALRTRRSVRDFAPRPLTLPEAADLLFAAQGVTAQDGGRTAPSAGALYPLEVRLVAADVGDLAAGSWRYVPARHELAPERRGDLRASLADAALRQSWIADAPALIVFSAVYERTTRKYGDRGRRYVHMEVGHAAQNLLLRAAALGLGATMVGAFDDDALARALGLPEEERPLAVVAVGRPAVTGRPE